MNETTTVNTQPDFCAERLAEIIREVDGKHDKGAAALAEAILSHPGIRSAGLTAAPVPVSERLPGLDVKCWWFDSTKQWYFRSWEEINIAGLRQPTHWLPASALPVP